MMSLEGIKMFEEFVRKLNISPDAKADLIRRMQEMLNQKVPVERHTAVYIDELQKKGCWVFGLTARYSTMAEETATSLSTLGVDLEKTSLLSRGTTLIDHSTRAVYASGVLFTNNSDKGQILERFLDSVVFGPYRDVDNGIVSSCMPPKLPSEIHFVDDRLLNAESVLRGLQLPQEHGVDVHCYHYTAASVDHVSRSLTARERKIAETQIRHFVNNCMEFEDTDVAGLVGCLLSDEEAEARHL